MTIVPLLLLAGAVVAAAALAGGLAGLIATPAVAWLTYRWAVRDARLAELRRRRLASFPAIPERLTVGTLPDEAAAQARLVLDAVTTEPVEARR